MRVPGMLHGRVIRPAAVGAHGGKCRDESSIKGLPGIVKVVVKKNFVGLVAQKPWQAVQAANQLKVTWTAGSGLPSQATFYEHLRNQKPSRDTLLTHSGDLEQKPAESATAVKATYYYPYQMHGSVGSSCAVADVQSEKVTVWSPTQAVWHQRDALAMLLGVQAANVRVIFRQSRGSGCYGLERGRHGHL